MQVCACACARARARACLRLFTSVREWVHEPYAGCATAAHGSAIHITAGRYLSFHVRVCFCHRAGTASFVCVVCIGNLACTCVCLCVLSESRAHIRITLYSPVGSHFIHLQQHASFSPHTQTHAHNTLCTCSNMRPSTHPHAHNTLWRITLNSPAATAATHSQGIRRVHPQARVCGAREHRCAGLCGPGSSWQWWCGQWHACLWRERSFGRCWEPAG